MDNFCISFESNIFTYRFISKLFIRVVGFERRMEKYELSFRVFKVLNNMGFIRPLNFFELWVVRDYNWQICLHKKLFIRSSLFLVIIIDVWNSNVRNKLKTICFAYNINFCNLYECLQSEIFSFHLCNIKNWIFIKRNTYLYKLIYHQIWIRVLVKSKIKIQVTLYVILWALGFWRFLGLQVIQGIPMDAIQ